MSDQVTVLRAAPRCTLEELADRAKSPLEAVGAERAIAFGSWARGTADGYSDLDLVVVLETDLPRAERWRLLTDLLDALPLPADLLVYTPAEFARGMRARMGVFDSIAREGVTIHEQRAR